MKSLVLGTLEQEVLSVIWNSSTPLCVRAVLNSLKQKVAYTTVMTVMNRMEKKGLLKRIPEGNSYIYTYTEDQQTYVKNHLGTLFTSLMNSYGDLAISEFISCACTTEKNIKLLKEFLSTRIS